MKRIRPDPYKLRRLRLIIQIGFLVLFSFLLIKVLLVGSSGSWIPLIIFTVVTLVLTLVLGRVWCGWVCPMGTVLYWVRFKGAIYHEIRLSKRWWSVKYILLFLIIVGLLLGLWKPVLDWMDANIGLTAIFFGLIVISSIGMNFFANLFWCRYLCPLGGLVALVSRIAPMRRIVRAHCNQCSVCVDACPMGAIDPRRNFVSDPGGCTICIDCLTSCTSSSNGFRFSRLLGEQK